MENNICDTGIKPDYILYDPVLSESTFVIKSKLLKAEILKNSKTLCKILSEIQPYKVTKYEIERSIKTLDSMNKNTVFFNKKVDQISVFMPSNLPLYSFILFGIVSSFMSYKKLYIKPNQLMREKEILEKVSAILNVERVFKNIKIINDETLKFINEYVPSSDVIIFTGYNKNRDKILSMVKPGSLLIYNGSGHNSIVIGRNANTDKAAKDSCFARFFNSGQDCAGPDAILVHESIFDDYMKKYLMEVKKLKVGKYDDESIDIGPITRKTELQKFLNILHDCDGDKVKIGGVFDMKNKIINPTIISSNLSFVSNHEEIFGPISFVYRYNEDEDVSLYFRDTNGTYMRNKMYVSLYGENLYVSLRDDNKIPTKNGIEIILYDKNVHDYEEGDKAYGGYSLGASGVFYKIDEYNFTSKAFPIYIPEIIAFHVENKIYNKNVQISKKENISNITDGPVILEIGPGVLGFECQTHYHFLSVIKIIFDQYNPQAFYWSYLILKTA